MKKLNNEKKHNLKIKMACLLFAFLMWVYVMSTLDPVDTREIKGIDVAIENLSQIQDVNLTVSPNQTLKADIKLKYRRSVMANKIKEGIKLKTTIKNPKIGLNESEIEVAGDMSDIAYLITPAKLSVKLEENKIKSEKINIKSLGSLAQNCIIDTMAISKSNIYISGPESLIKKVYKVQAEVSLDNANQDFTKRCKLKVIDRENKEIEGIQLDTENVLITVKVIKEKILPIKANIQSNVAYSDEDFEIIPDKIKITGNSVTLADLNAVETIPFKLDELLKQKEINVNLAFPKGCNSAIKSVKVISHIKTEKNLKEDEIEFSGEDLYIENGDDLTKEQKESIKIPEAIKVKIPDDNKEIKKDQIKLYVDANELSTGKLKIKYKSDKEIKDLTIEPSFIDVNGENLQIIKNADQDTDENQTN